VLEYMETYPTVFTLPPAPAAISCEPGHPPHPKALFPVCLSEILAVIWDEPPATPVTSPAATEVTAGSLLLQVAEPVVLYRECRIRSRVTQTFRFFSYAGLLARRRNPAPMRRQAGSLQMQMGFVITEVAPPHQDFPTSHGPEHLSRDHSIVRLRSAR
jgi:hypothetical protein